MIDRRLSSPLLLGVLALNTGYAVAEFGCKPRDERRVELATALPLGFTADQLLLRIQGDHATTVVWHDGQAEAATWRIAFDGGRIRYVERYFDDAGSGRELAASCPNRLELDVRMQLRLAQGGRIEFGSATLLAPTLRQLTHDADVDVSTAPELLARLPPTDREQLSLGRAELMWHVTLDGAELRGELAVRHHESDGADPAYASVSVSTKRLAWWTADLAGG